jgi:ABC-type multidrug transport system fused ATPase/permease subunit
LRFTKFPPKYFSQIFPSQDPTVFEGTIRFNIDPFDEFPDARLWEAVQSVQLMPYIRTLPDAG